MPVFCRNKENKFTPIWFNNLHNWGSWSQFQKTWKEKNSDWKILLLNEKKEAHSWCHVMDVTLVSGWVKRSRPCWQHYDVSKYCQPVFSQKFGPGPSQYRKNLLMSLVCCQTRWRLTWSDIHMDIIKERFPPLDAIWLLGLVRHRIQAAKLFHHSFAQINVSRAILVNTGRLYCCMMLCML